MLVTTYKYITYGESILFWSSFMVINLSHTITILFFFSDGQMYTASQYEFWSSPDIRRNSPNPTLRTEEAPTRWLYGQ